MPRYYYLNTNHHELLGVCLNEPESKALLSDEHDTANPMAQFTNQGHPLSCIAFTKNLSQFLKLDTIEPDGSSIANFHQNELDSSTLTELYRTRRCVSTNQASPLTGEDYTFSIHYLDDEQHPCGLSMNYLHLPSQPPQWIIVHTRQTHQKPQQRPSLLICTENFFKFFPNAAAQKTKFTIVDTKDITPPHEQLLPEIHSRAIQKLLEPLFTLQSEAELKFYFSNFRHRFIGRKNLDDRDLKIPEILKLLQDYSLTELSNCYQKRFLAELDFFSDAHYPQHLKELFQQLQQHHINTQQLLPRMYQLINTHIYCSISAKIRHSTEFHDHQSLLTMMEFWRQSPDPLNTYVEKLQAYVRQQQQQFKQHLVYTMDIRIAGDTLDIAQSYWEQKLLYLTQQNRGLKKFKQKIQDYCKIYQQIYQVWQENLSNLSITIRDDQTTPSLIQLLTTEFRCAETDLQQHRATLLEPNDPYQHVIQHFNFAPTVSKQILCWEQYLKNIQTRHPQPDLSYYQETLKFYQKITAIYKHLKAANNALFNEFNTSSCDQQFAKFQAKVQAELARSRPLKIHEKLIRAWQASAYQQEIIMIASAILSTSLINPWILTIMPTALFLGVVIMALVLITMACRSIHAKQHDAHNTMALTP